jgi:hypothetical protein
MVKGARRETDFPEIWEDNYASGLGVGRFPSSKKEAQSHAESPSGRPGSLLVVFFLSAFDASVSRLDREDREAFFVPVVLIRAGRFSPASGISPLMSIVKTRP